ncbi:hypothetical protein SNE40_020375 [Patella caerulea]|uniref:Uncharacterized protein n=1 Tax=Patella caerulea TaxID=87958 RepID=A0AAN8J4M6_PATCE
MSSCFNQYMLESCIQFYFQCVVFLVEPSLDDKKAKEQSVLKLGEDKSTEQEQNKEDVNNSTDFFWIGVGVGGAAVVIVGVTVMLIYCKNNRKTENRNTKVGNTGVTDKFKEAHEYADENLYSSTHQKRMAEPHIYAVTTTNSDYVILC